MAPAPPPPPGRRMRRASAVATPGASSANVAPSQAPPSSRYVPNEDAMMMPDDTSQSSSQGQSSRSSASPPPPRPAQQTRMQQPAKNSNKEQGKGGGANKPVGRPVATASTNPSDFNINAIMGNVGVATSIHRMNPSATSTTIPPPIPTSNAQSFNIDQITGTVSIPKARVPSSSVSATRSSASQSAVNHINEASISDFDIDQLTGSIISPKPSVGGKPLIGHATPRVGMDFDVNQIMGNVAPITPKHPKIQQQAGNEIKSGAGGPTPPDLGALLGNVSDKNRVKPKDSDAETVISRVTGFDINAIAGNVGMSPPPSTPSSWRDHTAGRDGKASIVGTIARAPTMQPHQPVERIGPIDPLPANTTGKWNRYRIAEPSATTRPNNNVNTAGARGQTAVADALAALDVVELYQSKDDVDLLFGGTIEPTGVSTVDGSNAKKPVKFQLVQEQGTIPQSGDKQENHRINGAGGANYDRSEGSYHEGPQGGGQAFSDHLTRSKTNTGNKNDEKLHNESTKIPITGGFSLDNATQPTASTRLPQSAPSTSFNLDAVTGNFNRGPSAQAKTSTSAATELVNGHYSQGQPGGNNSGGKAAPRENGPPAPPKRKAPIPAATNPHDFASVPSTAGGPSVRFQPEQDRELDRFSNQTIKVEPFRTSLKDSSSINQESSDLYRGNRSDSGLSSDNDYELSGSDRSTTIPKPSRLNQGNKSVSLSTDERLEALTSSNNENSTEFGHLARVAGRTLARFVKLRVLMLNDDPENFEKSEVFQNRNPDLMAQKMASRRPLSTEQKELLRCIGLDAFMTLRFLKFGFDISFWPMVLAVFTIIPVYNTAGNGVVGFFSTTVVALQSHQVWRYWVACSFGIIYYLYILRRLWIEWELFLPLRYDYLENGDFQKEKYKEQFRKTCLIEYVPRAFKHDDRLKCFFEAVFPGEVKRAEVLLNTEQLRSLIEQRRHHIVAYEDTYAYKVHLRATYLRDLESYENSGPVKRCCRVTGMPRAPVEPTIVVKVEVPRHRLSSFLGFSFNRQATAKEPRTLEALKYHFEQIQRLNKEVDAEYLRLAKEQRRPVLQQKESRFSKWLGVKYLFSSDTGHLHSSTAFVEFKSLATKQQAIQCNITGMNKFMVVKPVPEVRDIEWDNIHISLRVINTRKAWMNAVLFGGLIFWAFLVSVIRGYKRISSLVNITGNLAIFINFYAPALIVEGLTRAIPLSIKLGCKWIRFKTISEGDHYLLRWYFAYRLLTFIFIIVAGTGGSLLDQGKTGIRNPLGFIRTVSGNVSGNSQFFFSYVIVVGGIQLFLRLSQTHNLFIFWFIQKVKTEESMSQRALTKIKSDLKAFHLDEFIPLFIFIFMVAALYGTIAPLSGLFVAAFYRIAFKVFKFMCLYIYGNKYESGGQIFYTMSTILFYVLYMLIIFLSGFWSLQVSNAMSTVFSLLVIVTFVVQRDVDNTFVEPSKTLSLTKARGFDDGHDQRSRAEKKRDAYLQAKQAWEAHEKKRREGNESGSDEDENLVSTKNLFKRMVSRSESGDLSIGGESKPLFNRRKGRKKSAVSESEESALARFEQRYQADNVDADGMLISGDEGTDKKDDDDFFIYRQPALNRATWETAPLPYRENLEREEVAEVWGDVRPEETRRVGRARRGSIAAMFG